jgi:hypothetical protein
LFSYRPIAVYIITCCFRDPRLNDEARAYSLFIYENFPAPKNFTLEAMRERSESVHVKVNEKKEN